MSDKLLIKNYIINLKLLGFENETKKLAKEAKRDELILNEKLFEKSNTPAMEIIIYFICNILEPNKLIEFNPYSLKGDEHRLFANIIQEIIKKYEDKKELPYGSSRRTYITSAYGLRVIKFLFNITKLALKKNLDKINFYKPDVNDNIKYKIMIKSLKTRIYQECNKTKDIITKVIGLRNEYKNYSNKLTNEFRDILQKQESLDKIYKQININDINDNLDSYNKLIKYWNIINNDIKYKLYDKGDEIINKIYPQVESTKFDINDNDIDLNVLVDNYNQYLHDLYKSLKQPIISPQVNDDFPYLQTSLNELNHQLDLLLDKIQVSKQEISNNITHYYQMKHNDLDLNNSIELCPPTPLTHIIPSLHSSPNKSIRIDDTPFKANDIENSVLNKAKARNYISNVPIFSPSLTRIAEENYYEIKTETNNYIQVNNSTRHTRTANNVKSSIFSPSPPKKSVRKSSPISIDITRNKDKINLDNEIFSHLNTEQDIDNLVDQIGLTTPIPSPPTIKRYQMNDILPDNKINNINTDIESCKELLYQMTEELVEENVLDVEIAEELLKEICTITTFDEYNLLNEEILKFAND